MSQLKKTLGFPMLTFYGTGMILGAGIYSIIGKAAEKTGDTLWLGFLLAGLAAFLTALSYAELSTMFPRAGAEFVYLREAFKKRKWLGSTAGLAMAFSGAATAATVAMAFSGYLAEFIDGISEGLVAAVVLLLFTTVAIIGIRASGWFNVVSTLIEVSGLVLIIYFGVTSEKFGAVLAEAPHLGTLSGSAIIIFSFFGFESIANLAEEAKEPKRDLPRAIILSVIISTVLYVLVALAAPALLSTEKLALSNAPLMDVARTASANIGKILGGIALFSTANTALISLIGASRILYGMANGDVLPKFLSKTLPRRQTPWLASLAVLITAGLFLPLGKLETVAEVSSLATMFVFFSVNIALVSLRKSVPATERPFRVKPDVGGLPVFPILGAAVTILLMTQFNLQIYAISGTFLLLAAVGFKWFEKK